MKDVDKITKEVSSFYDIVWTKYLPQIEEQKNFLIKYIGIENIKGKTILDAGCGTGVAAVCFKLLGAKDVYGVDISEGSLKTATELAKKNNAEVTFMKQNLLDLTLTKKFDVIHSFGVLHHTADAKRSFNNLMKLLKPHGKFYIALYLKTPLTIFQQIARLTFRLFPRSMWIFLSRMIKSFMSGKKKTKRGFDGEGDMLDWFFVPYRTHHTPKEISLWFREHRMKSMLLIAKTGRYASTSNFMMVGWR